MSACWDGWRCQGHSYVIDVPIGEETRAAGHCGPYPLPPVLGDLGQWVDIGARVDMGSGRRFFLVEAEHRAMCGGVLVAEEDEGERDVM